MPDLAFAVDTAEPVPYAAAPLLALKLRISNSHPEQEIRGIALQCQIQIEATRRRYADDEQAKLYDLFGEPERWSQTLRTTLWTHAAVNVRPFRGSTTVDLPVPCSFDFNVGITKYFHALESGDIPLCLLFSGTIFYEDDDGAVQMAQVPWSKEARFRLPVTVWKQVIEMYYPNTAWLMLRRDVFHRLYQYKMRSGLPTWEQAIENLLAGVEEGVPA